MISKIDLTNKTVVITGGGGVLCSFFGKALAAVGAKVALLDISKEKLQSAVADIQADGGIAKGYQANVLSKESLEEAYQAVKADFGGVDILINGAGGNHPMATTDNEYYEAGDLDKPDLKTFFSLEQSGIQKVFDLNFSGILLTTQVFTQDMVAGGGVVLNVSSMNAYRPLTKIPAYSAAKAAVSNFTAWLAVHFASANIRVNALAPGFFVTEQNRGLLFDKDGNPTPRSHKILSHTPMNRYGTPDDLRGTLYWLLDDNFSRFVTGIVVPIDGGFSAYSGV